MSNVENATVAPKSNEKPAKAATPRVLQPKPNKSAQRVPLAEDATATRTTTHNGSKSKIEYTFKLKDGDKDRYQVATTLDWTGVTEEQLKDLAIATIRIALQRNLRAMGLKALDQSVYAEVNVLKDIIETQREVADNVTKASRALQKLTDAERKAIIAQLQGVK
jgi:hypothetical protein